LNTEFRAKATLGVALAGLILLAPFTINHVRQGRMLLAVGTGIIVLTFAALAWVGRKGRYRPWVTFAALTPPMLFFLGVSLYEQGVIGALWCFPAILVFYFTLPERLAWISDVGLYLVAVPISFIVLEAPVAARVAATLAGVSVIAAIFIRMMGAQQRALEVRAFSDALTGLHNRALLEPTLEQAMEQSRRTGLPMTLLALDLDWFKSINDGLGHQAGDAALRGVADILRARIRRSDRAFRLGGEEFLAFLYGTDQERGRQVAEDLRNAVASKSLVPGRPITVSIGVASFSGDQNWEEWLRRCDQNLYGAKAAGRNSVVG
jgi:diguanylate cyclase (GGDEF)-like protein